VRLARAIGVIGVSCVLGFGCAASGNLGPEKYVVQPRDTLYSIAWRYDLDYRDLARWNNIGPDYRITVGQVLLLEPVAPKLAAHPPAYSVPPRNPVSLAHDVPRVSAPVPLGNAPAAAAASPSTAAPAPTDAPPSTRGVAASMGASKATALPGASMRCVWPTERSSAPRPVPGGGILLLGQLGQAVRAACTGRVVYIGSGLRGYGNLIIIKHGDNLLSAYAHNRELLVREGQNVSSGQDIARMGLGPHQIAALYFEIRLNGKPVDPLPYLSDAK
jgi:lipoprotein NlpD